MILDLQDHGFELLEGAAARRAELAAAATTSAAAKSAAIFQPSSFDRTVMPEGLKYTPNLLSRWLSDAAIGWTRDLDVFKDEMRARDPHLDGEIQDQTDMITSAKLDALAFPSFGGKGASRTSETKVADDVASFLSARYASPEFNLPEALTALCDGEWKWCGAFELTARPDPSPRAPERVVKTESIPSQRFSVEMTGTRLMFQPRPGSADLIPVDDLGPNGSAQLIVHLGDVRIPSPSRRGVLRRCMNFWLIKQRGLVWWAEFVQNLGTPPLMGFFDPDRAGARALLDKAFRDLGSGSKMILPKGTEVTPLEVALRLSGETPHERIADWCDRQNSRVISGHDQSSGVQVNAGSKQSSDAGNEKGVRRAQARAKRIAQTLREWDAKPAVAREFGPDAAEKFTSILSLRIDRPKNLLELSQAFLNFSNAGVETIPVQEFHEITGVRSPEEGEPCQPSNVRAAQASPGTTGVDSTAAGDEAAALARILPFARAAVQAAASKKAEPADLLEALLSKAKKRAAGSGEEIVRPYRDLIVAAVEEGATVQQIVVRVLHRLNAQLEAPELEDLLAATIAEAALRGAALERDRAAKPAPAAGGGS